MGLSEGHQPVLVASSELRLCSCSSATSTAGAQLGEGTYSKVFCATWRRQKVAVKWLRPEVLRIPRELACIIKEVDTLSRLNHRHVVRLLGVGTSGAAGGSVLAPEFLVMELCEGGSLGEVVERAQLARHHGRTVFQTGDALRWCMQIASALDYLHTCDPQIIHRDIKLHNVLLRGCATSASEAVLADFGLHATVVTSRALFSHDARTLVQTWTEGDSLLSACGKGDVKLQQRDQAARAAVAVGRPQPSSSSGAAALPAVHACHLRPPSAASSEAGTSGHGYALTGQTGSLGYMAPEVYLRQPYSHKSDVFSLGVLMWELLHQVSLQASVSSQGKGALEAYADAMARKGLRPQIRSSLEPQLAQLIRDCWAQDPSARPDMPEVMQRLEAGAAARELRRSAAVASAGCCGMPMTAKPLSSPAPAMREGSLAAKALQADSRAAGGAMSHDGWAGAAGRTSLSISGPAAALKRNIARLGAMPEAKAALLEREDQEAEAAEQQPAKMRTCACSIM